MADKKYRLSFEMTDGTKQSVEFAVPQGESVTPDYAAAEGEPGHILNRTHYMEMGEILPETTITLIDAECLLPQTIEFTKGDTYKVKWNGTEYECIADTAESDYGTSSFIGNASVMDGEDNGMPFVLAAIPGVGTAVFYLEAASGESEVVLSISGPTVHKLDPKYLPDNVTSIFNVDFVIDFSDSEMTATTTIPFSVIYAKASDPNIIVRGIGTSSLGEGKMEFQLTECRMDSIVFVYTQVGNNKIEFYALSVQPDNSVTVSYTRVMQQ